VELAYRTFDVGLLYRVRQDLHVGLMAKNIYGASPNEGYEHYALPRYVTLGLSSQIGAYTVALDSEVIFGRFGRTRDTAAQFWFVRAGLEKKLKGGLHARLGLIYPVVAYTSAAGDMREEIPSPKMGGAAGIGAEIGRISFDFTMYGDPVRSYVEQQRVLTAVGTITMKL